jgi:hypothetical protein
MTNQLERMRKELAVAYHRISIENFPKYGGNNEKTLSGLLDTWPRFEPKILRIRSSTANQSTVNFV